MHVIWNPRIVTNGSEMEITRNEKQASTSRGGRDATLFFSDPVAELLIEDSLFGQIVGLNY